MPVIAQNAKGQRQTFSDLAWKHLGKDKNGWTEVESQTVGNAVKKIVKPNMGPQTVGNAAKQPGKTEEELAEEAEIARKAEEFDRKYNQGGGQKTEPSAETKSEFLKEIEDLNRTAIKDFFDNQKPPVKYNNRANIIDLKNQLAEHCNYDLVKFQESYA